MTTEVKFDRIETKKRLTDLSYTEIYRSIEVVQALVVFQPPLNYKLTLLGYVHDLRQEIARRDTNVRELQEFTPWELRRSIDYAIELATLCPKLLPSQMLARFISALAGELDSRPRKTRGGRQRRTQKDRQGT
jgi:hypothetical protein